MLLFLSVIKKSFQLFYIILVCPHRNKVRAVLMKLVNAIFLMPVEQFGIGVPGFFASGIHPVQGFGLAVHHFYDPHVRQLPVHLVIYAHAYKVMLACGQAERLFKRRAQEIAYQEANGLLPDHVIEKGQCLGNVSAGLVGGFGSKELPDDPQDMGFALLGRDELFHLVAEQQEPHLIIIGVGGKGQYGAQFRDDIFFGCVGAAEDRAVADVGQQHQRLFPLLFKDLDIGRREPGRYIPVYRPDIISRYILPNLAEGHALAFEGSMVIPGENMIAQAFRFDLYLSNL